MHSWFPNDLVHPVVDDCPIGRNAKVKPHAFTSRFRATYNVKVLLLFFLTRLTPSVIFAVLEPLPYTNGTQLGAFRVHAKKERKSWRT